MSRQLFVNNFSDYTGAPKRSVTKGMRNSFPTDMGKLESSVLELHGFKKVLAKRASNGLPEHFIVMGKTTTTEGRDFITAFENDISTNTPT